MTLNEFHRKAMFVPFLEKGRSYDGWDCWGLVYCAYRDVFGIDLPTYQADYRHTKDFQKTARIVEKAKLDGWDEVADPRAGLVAAILGRTGDATHVGLVLPSLNILHCETGCHTVVERPAALPIEGYYERAV